MAQQAPFNSLSSLPAIRTVIDSSKIKASIPRRRGGRSFTMGSQVAPFKFKHLMKHVIETACRASEDERRNLKAIIRGLKAIDALGHSEVKKQGLFCRFMTALKQIFGNLNFSRKASYAILERLSLEEKKSPEEKKFEEKKGLENKKGLNSHPSRHSESSNNPLDSKGSLPNTVESTSSDKKPSENDRTDEPKSKNSDEKKAKKDNKIPAKTSKGASKKTTTPSSSTPGVKKKKPKAFKPTIDTKTKITEVFNGPSVNTTRRLAKVYKDLEGDEKKLLANLQKNLQNLDKLVQEIGQVRACKLKFDEKDENLNKSFIKDLFLKDQLSDYMFKKVVKPMDGFGRIDTATSTTTHVLFSRK